MEGLNDVKQELETKRAALAKELESAKEHLGKIEADLRRVDDALGALTKPKKRSRSKSRSKKASPSPQAPLPHSQEPHDPWSPARSDSHQDFDFGHGQG